MKIGSILFYKKFDYAAFPIGLLAFLLIIGDLIYNTSIDSSLLYSQLLLVILYYIVTRGNAESNYLEKGINPVIVLTFFACFVILAFIVNAILIINLLI